MSERLKLRYQPDLGDFQEYVKKVMEGSQQGDMVDDMLLLSEYLGRLAKAARVRVGLSYRAGSKIPEADDALAGLFFHTVNLANRLGIDLEVAFRSREKRQRRRKNRE